MAEQTLWCILLFLREKEGIELDESAFQVLLHQRESAILEFKSRAYDLSNVREKASLIKDVVAMANTPRTETAHIILGVSKQLDGTFSQEGLDRFFDDADYQILVSNLISPLPVFIYQAVTFMEKQFGIISIPPTRTGPHVALKDYPPDPSHTVLRAFQVYIRRGGMNDLARPEDIRRLVKWIEEGDVQQFNSGPRADFPQTPPSLFIADKELRRRCGDLLLASDHYDRAIREACVILEDRVRSAVGAEATLVGVPLMEHAFGTTGRLRLSDIPQEQVGVMQLYRGVMAFFRNSTGHRVIDTYSQADAIRFVVWIDLLLKMVATAGA